MLRSRGVCVTVGRNPHKRFLLIHDHELRLTVLDYIKTCFVSAETTDCIFEIVARFHQEILLFDSFDLPRLSEPQLIRCVIRIETENGRHLR